MLPHDALPSGIWILAGDGTKCCRAHSLASSGMSRSMSPQGV